MPFDGSGNFNRVMNWVADAAAGTKILATRHDQEDDNLASGLSNTLTKDGQSQPTANIPMNGKRLTNVGAPTTGTDAATKTYVDSIRSFSTAITLSGAAPEGRIAFTAADLAFGTRAAGTPAGSLNRFVWNDAPTLGGSDVAVMDETGKLGLVGAGLQANTRSGITMNGDLSLTSGYAVGWNSYYDSNAATFKAVATGFGTRIIGSPSDGTIALARAPSVAAGAAQTYGNVLVMDTANGVTFVDSFLQYGNGTGAVNLQGRAPYVDSFKISGSGMFRWYKSSTGLLSGSGLTSLMTLDDAGNLAATGSITAAGTVTANQFFQAASANLVLGATGSGQVLLRPNGVGVTAGQAVVTSAGTLAIAGKLQFDSYLESTANVAVLGTTGAGTIYQRPNGIASTTGQAYLDASGNYTISGSVATKATAGQWVAPSDIRLKDVRGDYAHGLTELLQIQPVLYNYKTDPDTEIIGLIAQDIEGVFPECVSLTTGDVEGKSVNDLRQYDPTALQYALINAVKELSAKLDAATARIAVLEGTQP